MLPAVLFWFVNIGLGNGVAQNRWQAIILIH